MVDGGGLAVDDASFIAAPSFAAAMASFSQARGTLQLGSRGRDAAGSTAGRADTPPPGPLASSSSSSSSKGTAAAADAGEGGEELVRLLFAQYSPSSSNYNGLDVEVALKLSTLVFYCNRPTVAALMVFGTDLAAINTALAAPHAQQQVRQDWVCTVVLLAQECLACMQPCAHSWPLFNLAASIRPCQMRPSRSKAALGRVL
jgi:vacuolar protein sorting-associated protein 13A/C